MIPCPSNSASLSLVHRVPVTRADLKSMWPYGARLPRASPALDTLHPWPRRCSLARRSLLWKLLPLPLLYPRLSLLIPHSHRKGTVRVYARVSLLQQPFLPGPSREPSTLALVTLRPLSLLGCLSTTLPRSSSFTLLLACPRHGSLSTPPSPFPYAGYLSDTAPAR